jgi:hypothetical protein
MGADDPPQELAIRGRAEPMRVRAIANAKTMSVLTHQRDAAA